MTLASAAHQCSLRPCDRCSQHIGWCQRIFNGTQLTLFVILQPWKTCLCTSALGWSQPCNLCNHGVGVVVFSASKIKDNRVTLKVSSPRTSLSPPLPPLLLLSAPPLHPNPLPLPPTLPPPLYLVTSLSLLILLLPLLLFLLFLPLLLPSLLSLPLLFLLLPLYLSVRPPLSLFPPPLSIYFPFYNSLPHCPPFLPISLNSDSVSSSLLLLLHYCLIWYHWPLQFLRRQTHKKLAVVSHYRGGSTITAALFNLLPGQLIVILAVTNTVFLPLHDNGISLIQAASLCTSRGLSSVRSGRM